MNLSTVQGARLVSSLDSNLAAETLVLRDENGSDLIEIRNPFQRFDDGSDISPYEVIVFSRRNWPEAQVWIIEEGRKDVGHIFSVEALASTESILIEDKYTKIAAVIALKRLCLGRTYNEVPLRPCATGREISIDELYPENSVVAIISRERIVALGSQVMNWGQFVLDRLPVFSQQGLHLQPQTLGRRTYDAPSISMGPAENRKLKLTGISGHFPAVAREFLQNILLKVVPFEEHPAFRFFLCYQLLEVLMEDLHDRIVQTFLREASNSTQGEFRALLKSLQQKVTQADRLSRLIVANQRAQLFEDLRIACNALLTAVYEKVEPSTASAIYSVRNVLFHRFISAESSGPSINYASDLMFQICCELALKYQVPEANL